jgi:competence protein ComEC
VRLGRTGTDTSLGTRVALWGINEVVSLLFASLLAGTATTPFAAYHFHRMAPYGVLANLLAMPVVSAVVMPAGLAALLLMPFGLDGALWKLMEFGLNWMDAVALWVAHLPGAVGRIAQFGAGPLLVVTVGLLVLCLLQSPLRWGGAAFGVLGCLWALHTPQPEVLIAQSGDPVAVRGTDGTLAIIRKSGDSFALREWLASDADSRMPADPALSRSVVCDDIGCVARLADGAAVTLALSPEAFEDDCRLAALIVSYRKPPPDCGALVIDRNRRMQTGALALRRVDSRWEMVPARPHGLERPWAPAAAARSPGAPELAPAAAGPPATGHPAARDATPNQADIEPGD